MSAPDTNTPTELIVNEKNIELDGGDTSSQDQDTISFPFDTSKIRIEAKPMTIDLLIGRIKNKEIDLMPDFQREAGIWKDKEQSRLIESLLLRIPIPAFYFDATDDEKWLVVDGLQRLTALNRFILDKDLTLQDLEFLGDKYNNASYDKLPRPLQRTILETVLTTYQIMPGTPAKVKFNVFKRINTGGLSLSPQEIRHALNQGSVTRKLEQLAESDEFKVATAGGVSPKRMDDRDCIARFIAFSLTSPDAYKDDYDTFINAGMEKANLLMPKQLEAICENFLRVMRYIPDIFGSDAFRKRYRREGGRYPVNKALFETWTVNLGSLSEQDMEVLISRKETLKDAFIALMNNRDFENSVSQGTGSVARVQLRYAAIQKIIKETLHA
ncbi:MAG: DUF262 domain-containing protein [Desulfovibrionaceae bacterium]|nr:DUF262 domain-containing protein [Desulfovibrionaceae bacterium]